QIETGLAKEWISASQDSYEQETRYGTTLLRFGLFDFMEFRLGSDLLNNRSKLPAGADSADFGGSPIGIGFKFALARENGLVPDVALITSWQIPNTGNAVYSSDKWQHSYVVSVAHTLSYNWGIGYNLGYEFEGGFEKSAFKYSLAGGYSIDERWGAYIELYGSRLNKVPWDFRTDAGLTFLLFPNFQLDLSGGAGLTRVSSVGFISGGFSWRIPR
ncbi:MAG: transporter, partial [Bacteroidales bacterium]|nr:transporter [Bacteroidales bacterium]